MALEDILKKIDEDARAEADSLQSLARAEADSLRERARREAAELRADLMQKAEERAKRHADRVKVLAGLDRRKRILKEKKRLLDEVFERAQKRILSLPPKEYLALLTPLIVHAVESGNEEIIPASAQRHLFTPEFLRSLNQELGHARGNVRLSAESGSFLGGFILREKNQETNMTIESLIDSQHEALEPQVAKVLFGEKERHG